jgi:hypothetical protein
MEIVGIIVGQILVGYLGDAYVALTRAFHSSNANICIASVVAGV